MTDRTDKENKKEIMKDIILNLHRGLSPEAAKNRFEEEVGTISSTEIADIEQSLINEGLAPEEIKKFCNVHALLFQSALEKSVSRETSPAHPVYLFKLENKEIEKTAASLSELIEKRKELDLAELKKKLLELLHRLRGVETHYERKEQLLFPYLEKRGFTGPSKVMWGKDNEIRELLKKAAAGVKKINNAKELESYAADVLSPLIEEVNGMIFKEENILLPTSLEKLRADDWVNILKESDEVGYAFIEKPRETEALLGELKESFSEEPTSGDGRVSLPTGAFQLEELMAVLNTLPVDITFVDKDDKVRYFSESRDRIFVRTRSVIGREVKNCHPPQSVDAVEKIVRSFKERKRDSVDFRINFKGRLILIRYFAVRDEAGAYLGTLEVTQDITGIKKLEGEKRLLDERD